MNNNGRSTGRSKPILVLALVSFAVLLPVLFIGIPAGYDMPHHFQCAMTYAESIRSGDIYPSWSASRNFGYGGMEARLYPPLSHYTLALTYLATLNWQMACWLTLLIFTLVGAVGVFLWANEYVDVWPAVFAGCMFTLFPYHLSQVYNTFVFAEYAATGLLPFTFLFVSRICRRGHLADVIGLSGSFAALVLTHLPLSLIGSICFGIYAVAKLKKQDLFSSLGKLAAGVGLGLAVSSFFWIKVIQERGYLAKASVYPNPWLDYRYHFLLTPIQDLSDGWPLAVYEACLSVYDPMLLCGAVLACAFLGVAIVSARRQIRSILAPVAVYVTASFFAVPFSRPLWDRLAALQEVQFPWRWLAIISVAAPVVASAGVAPLTTWFRSPKRALAMLVLVVPLAVIAFSIIAVIRPASLVPRDETPTAMTGIEEKLGETFWWTNWTRKEAFTITDKVLASERTIDILQWSGTRREFDVAAGGTTEARVAVLYYPLWQVTVNGTIVDPHPGEDGALNITIPVEPAYVRLDFRETAVTVAAQYISLLAAVLMFSLGVVSRKGFRLPAILAPSYPNDYPLVSTATPDPFHLNSGQTTL